MNVRPSDILFGLAIGVGATLAMDLWNLLLKRVFGIPSLNYCFLGRWLLHIPAGTFRHASIASAKPRPRECAVGWIGHYSIGISLALVFVIFGPAGWIARPTLLPALLYGMVTVVFPLFVLQPSLGFGIASSKAPHPMRARLKSLMTHAVFGVGLFACAWGVRYALGSPSPGTWTEPKTGIELARIPAGRFVMGSPLDEAGREEQELLHEVEISHAFYLATTEVTQRQWQRVMGSNPSRLTTCGPDCPVEQVSWFQVQAFTAQLGRLAGHRFRLPTEAEWEYACRAGTSTPFSTGSSLSTDQANFDGEGPYRGSPPGLFRRSTTRVRTFSPSSFGLFDMHGNVWEWTQDWHCPYPRGRVRDPLGACRTDFKVIRGGSWYFDANSARCALRYTHRPQDSGFSLGFRVAMSADDLRAAA